MLVQAASRGLQEELGISVAATSLKGPLVPTHLRQLHVPEVGVTDCEFVTSFRSASPSCHDQTPGMLILSASSVSTLSGCADSQMKVACRLDEWQGHVIADPAEVHA